MFGSIACYIAVIFLDSKIQQICNLIFHHTYIVFPAVVYFLVSLKLHVFYKITLAKLEKNGSVETMHGKMD